VILRIATLGRAPGADEAGFLMVGGQWRPGGTSLYGDYWVDRPPLLITIFGLAAHLGGLVPLRLVGALAALLVVLGAAWVSRRLGGDRAATWAALVAAALCVSPLLGALEVNGELLAAPFVTWGLAAAITAVRRDRATALWSAAAAGAALVAALLVKQNIADVGVFAGTAVVIARVRGEISSQHVRRVVAAFLGGAAVCLAATAGWTLLHGTSLTGVLDAMYPFRVEAARAIATSGSPAHTARMWGMLAAWAVSGVAVVMVVALWALVSRRLRGTVLWALAATIVFDSVSVMLGGSYWSHYLVQLAGPVAIVSGVLMARRQPGARFLLSYVVVAAVVAWAVVLPRPAASVGSTVGDSIGDVSQPRDTIVTVYGHSDVSQASGLSSPYPYLWSLPIKTLDPRLHRLDRVLGGPTAPTWFVTWGRVSSWGVTSTTTARLVARHYHPVADVLGRTVYLHDGVTRSAPHAGDSASADRPVLVTTLEELLR
jgi:4-amino-4-deoxy-L-arabinose transferase-like glycosyltransferase